MKVDRSNKKKIKRAKIVKRHLKGMKKNHTHNNNNNTFTINGRQPHQIQFGNHTISNPNGVSFKICCSYLSQSAYVT